MNTFFKRNFEIFISWIFYHKKDPQKFQNKNLKKCDLPLKIEYYFSSINDNKKKIEEVSNIWAHLIKDEEKEHESEWEKRKNRDQDKAKLKVVCIFSSRVIVNTSSRIWEIKSEYQELT